MYFLLHSSSPGFRYKWICLFISYWIQFLKWLWAIKMQSPSIYFKVKVDKIRMRKWWKASAFLAFVSFEVPAYNLIENKSSLESWCHCEWVSFEKYKYIQHISLAKIEIIQFVEIIASENHGNEKIDLTRQFSCGRFFFFFTIFL